MKEQSKFPGGTFHMKLFNSIEDFHNNKPLKEWSVHNKMTNASLAVLAGLVGNTGSQTAFGYLALGSSSTAVSASHTALQSEYSTVGLSRHASVQSRTTTTQTNDTLNFVYSPGWTASGAGGTVEEIGIFNDPTAGTMLARALTGTTAISSGQVFAATYTFQIVGN